MNRRLFFSVFAGATVSTLPLAAAVPSLTVEPTERWIPVEEQLPDPDVDVLCVKYHYGKKYQQIDKVLPHYGSTPFHGKLWFVGDNHKPLTTHWRPLLEFPKDSN